MELSNVQGRLVVCDPAHYIIGTLEFVAPLLLFGVEALRVPHVLIYAIVHLFARLLNPILDMHTTTITVDDC